MLRVISKAEWITQVNPLLEFVRGLHWPERDKATLKELVAVAESGQVFQAPEDIEPYLRGLTERMRTQLWPTTTEAAYVLALIRNAESVMPERKMR